ncbi:hypothetical protein QE152_g25688 [Popillia japonica]|uniref:Integrase catalytic domain-containing protein n=1 Tax=Popillia japonica TaxID=7064 RepID=A0AAW1JZS3_POPJA
MRWVLYLQDYNYSIEHRSCNRMNHVYALSRVILVVEDNTIEQNLQFIQNADADIQQIRRSLEQRESSLYELSNGLVYRKHNGHLLFVVPKVMKHQILHRYHNEMGHFSVEKTVGENSTRKKTYFGNNGCFYKIHQVICICPKRLVSDRGSAFTARLFEDAMVEWNVQHVLVATGTPRANGQVERFNRVITSMLAKIVTEQDRWDEALDQVEFNLNNTVNKSTGDTPSKLLFGIHQRGKTEDHLREAIGREEGRRDFPVRREIAANKINSSQDYNARYFKKNHKAGDTPSKLLFGIHQRGKTEDHLREAIGREEGRRDFPVRREIAANKINSSQDYNARYFKKNHKAPRIYSPGDYVMLTNTVTTAGVNKKLLPRYVVTDVEGFQLTQVPFEGIFESSRIRPWADSNIYMSEE